MELNLLSSILRELILEHDRVSLPGMGSFIAEMAPSVFSDKAMVIHPPFRRILFRTSEVWNDGLLEGRYAAERGISESEAVAEISVFVKMMKIELNSSKHFKIPDFGSMRATEQNDYFFVAEKGLFNYLEGFGLEPINLKVLNRRGVVETLTGKPVPFDIPKEPELPEEKEDVMIIGEIEQVKDNKTFKEAKEAEKSVKIDQAKMAEKSDKAEKKDKVKAVEAIDLVERSVMSAEVKKEELDNKAVKENLTKERPNKTVKEKEKEVQVKSQMVSSKASSEASEKPEVISQKIVNTKKAERSEKSSKFVKRFVIILSAIFLIIVIVALLFIFKDEMRPFWEWLLYTQEEREILRSN